MIYLGLGSNLGDRTGYLRRAFSLLLERKIIVSPIRVSSVYRSPAMLPAGAPPSWDREFFNCVLEAETHLEPLKILREIKQIEVDLGRDLGERWAPRKIDIDFLVDTRGEFLSERLQLPHPGLKDRDFVSLPLLELGFEVSAVAPARGAESLGFKLLPSELVGIMNLTPDSFSDGKLYLEPERALQGFEDFAMQGASVVDLGAESTRPQANLVSAEEEWARLQNILPEISRMRRSRFPWIKLSLDTRHPQTMERALEFGVDWMNDVSAGAEKKSLDFIKTHAFDFVWMHHLSIPADRKILMAEDKDPVQELKEWSLQKIQVLESSGIDPARCIFDVGIGFGKSPTQSLRLIQAGRESLPVSNRVLFGHSRKSFLSLITQDVPSQRDIQTACISSFLSRKNVDYLRVHNVQASRQAIEASLLVGQ